MSQVSCCSRVSVKWLLCANFAAYLIALHPMALHADTYTLESAIARAQAQDPWLQGSLKRQENLESLSISASTLPDPSISIGLANMPVDTFEFDQEPMTQAKIGITQMFPRGNTQSLQREKLARLSQMQPLAREDRNATVAVTVAHLWLEVYRNEQTIKLIEHDRGLFEYLVDVAESSYTTAARRTRQQDFIRAQLELTRLEDRLTLLHQSHDAQLARLGEWLINDSYNVTINAQSQVNLTLIAPDLVGLVGTSNSQTKQAQLASVLSAHPKIKGFNQKVSAGESEIELAKQSYKTQWGINANYGYRDDDPMGMQRSDFISVGVTFDLPVFTNNRQDKHVQAAVAEQEAIKTDRALMLRQLRSGFNTAAANYLRLLERKTLFDDRLLKQMSEQAEASLSAYTNNDGDFAEVVRARIAELNARIEALNIRLDIQKSVAELNYFLVASEQSNAVNTAAGDTHE